MNLKSNMKRGDNIENNKFNKKDSDIEEISMSNKRRKKPSKGVRKGKIHLKKPKRRTKK